MAGVLMICNCAREERQPADEAVHYMLAPYDSIGVAYGDTTQMFGDISDAAWIDHDRIAIVDSSKNKIYIFSDSCEYITSIDINGQGPGKLTRAIGIEADSCGNIYISGIYDRKIVIYNSQYEFIREIVFTDPRRIAPYLIAANTDTTVLVRSYIITDESDSAGTEIASFSNQGVPDVVYRQRCVPADHGIGIMRETAIAFTSGTNGRVYLSNMDKEYRIDCYSQDGDSIFSFSNPYYQPVLKAESIIQSEINTLRQQYVYYRGTDAGFSHNPDPYYISVASLASDGQGRVWARGEINNRSADVFSSQGEYLFSVSLDISQWQQTDRWIISVSDYGYLAIPINPEQYPVVYLLNEPVEQNTKE